MAKRATMTANHLGTMKAKKHDAVIVQAPDSQPSAKRAGDGRKGQTLRLTMEAWRQLKHMAADEDRSSHDLMLEGMNMLFKDRGKPPIA